MYSLQQLIKASASGVGSSSASNGSATSGDLYKFLRQISNSLTSSSPSSSSSSSSQAAAVSEPNFSDGVVSHNLTLCGNGCGKLVESESAQSVKFIRRFIHTQVHHLAKSSPSQQQQQQQHTSTKFAMSSLAAEPLQAIKSDEVAEGKANGSGNGKTVASCHEESTAEASSPGTGTGKKPCFNTGLAEIVQFMELIGNLKHTKRTGWVLRDVSDCESISGHMYRMSMLTFLLDGSEGLNQIRCMELALVHDLAESLVGDITPFCGVSKDEKRAMEFKAMEDICKLIEPRGKRIMELFEEYEHGQSPESKFVKDLDRLDMVMQAFEYEKRDNCLLKHQEFFDSTEGKFNHPFVKKLVNEIYEQRDVLAKAKGATPPPSIEVPSMETTTKLINGTSSS
ncbi:uncharacterized protein Dwil_GK24540 [Drosophila willistoni]|uniref:5'-deoxynucleotidase HDDC2 n=1 Tax=Drosophila willistoni TaxID=7260 RepID=B4N0A3_DROWI|nr:5'-deoxynucleotidase HDDC2 [Drosophila willistoni]XP_023032413.1 5'-deoxynucleotidase HDDC2 [Drosophila willistoni]EDW77516.1 uncharacterized protein Dwil_GK24540 [Drosophila willistoni]